MVMVLLLVLFFLLFVGIKVKQSWCGNDTVGQLQPKKLAQTTIIRLNVTIAQGITYLSI